MLEQKFYMINVILLKLFVKKNIREYNYLK